MGQPTTTTAPTAPTAPTTDTDPFAFDPVKQDAYSKLRALGEFDENPAAQQAAAKLVKLGVLHDLSGGSDYGTPQPEPLPPLNSDASGQSAISVTGAANGTPITQGFGNFAGAAPGVDVSGADQRVTPNLAAATAPPVPPRALVNGGSPPLPPLRVRAAAFLPPTPPPSLITSPTMVNPASAATPTTAQTLDPQGLAQIPSAPQPSAPAGVIPASPPSRGMVMDALGNWVRPVESAAGNDVNGALTGAAGLIGTLGSSDDGAEGGTERPDYQIPGQQTVAAATGPTANAVRNFAQGATAPGLARFGRDVDTAEAQGEPGNTSPAAALGHVIDPRFVGSNIKAGARAVLNNSGAEAIGKQVPELAPGTISGEAYNAITAAGSDPLNFLYAPSNLVLDGIGAAAKTGKITAVGQAIVDAARNAGPSVLDNMIRGAQNATFKGAKVLGDALFGEDRTSGPLRPVQGADGRIRVVPNPAFRGGASAMGTNDYAAMNEGSMIDSPLPAARAPEPEPTPTNRGLTIAPSGAAGRIAATPNGYQPIPDRVESFPTFPPVSGAVGNTLGEEAGARAGIDLSDTAPTGSSIQPLVDQARARTGSLDLTPAPSTWKVPTGPLAGLEIDVPPPPNPAGMPTAPETSDRMAGLDLDDAGNPGAAKITAMARGKASKALATRFSDIAADAANSPINIPVVAQSYQQVAVIAHDPANAPLFGGETPNTATIAHVAVQHAAAAGAVPPEHVEALAGSLAAAHDLAFSPQVGSLFGDESVNPTTIAYVAARHATGGGPIQPIGFTTAKGSTYQITDAGTTVRNKAARPQHPGDVGIKPASETTFYVAPENVNNLSEIQAQGGPGRRIAQLPDGSAAIQYTDGPSAGKFERRTVTPVETAPRVGLTPVELWNGGKSVHFGNAITHVNYGTAASDGRAINAADTQNPTVPAIVAPAAAEPAAVTQPVDHLPADGRLPTSEISVREDQFQFRRKRGVADFPSWNQAQADKNPVAVWRDSKGEIGPANASYVVNGHNRVFNARKFGVPSMAVRYINATTAKEAKEAGALENLMDSPRNDALDVAGYLRESPAALSAGDPGAFLRRMGVGTSTGVVKDALALAKLSPQAFDALVKASENHPGLLKVAAAAADAFPNAQRAGTRVMRAIEQLEAGQRVTPDQIVHEAQIEKDRADQAAQGGLSFDDGSTEATETRARVVSGLQKHFGELVSGGRKLGKQSVASFFGVSDDQRNLATVAAQVKEVIERTANRSTPLGEKVSAAVEAIRAGGDEGEITQQLSRELESGSIIGDSLDSRGGAAGRVAEPRDSSAYGLDAGGTDEPRTANGEVSEPTGTVVSGEPGARRVAGEVPKSGGSGGGTTLYSSIVPGADKFLSDDVVPVARQLGRGWRQTLAVVNPAALDPHGAATARSLRARLAEMDQSLAGHQHDLAGDSPSAIEKLRAKLLGKTVRDDSPSKIMDALPADVRWDSLDDYENGRPQATPQLQRVYDAVRKVVADNESKLASLGHGAISDFLQNYFAHVWKDPVKAERVISEFLTRRPLEGAKGFTKARTHMTVQDGMAAGLEPISDNPIDMMLLKDREVQKYIMAHNAIKDGLDAGYLHNVASGPAPTGYVKLSPALQRLVDADKVVRASSSVPGGWYAPEGVAHVLNNAISPGITHEWYRVLRTGGNFLNKTQLGMSGFHALFTLGNTVASDITSALDHASFAFHGGGIKAAAQVPLRLARAATIVGPSIHNAAVAKAIRAEYLHPGTGTPEIQRAVKALVQGGGSVIPDDMYSFRDVNGTGKTTAAQAWSKYKEGNVPGALLKGVLVPIENTTRPILEKYVPDMKAAVKADRALTILNRLGPGASPDTIKTALAESDDVVDNYYGELRYKNLFMHTVAKDAAMLWFRAFGFNLGSARAIGTTARDTATMPSRLARMVKGNKGKEEATTQSQRQALGYMMGMMYVGGVYMFLHTGKWPQTLKDYLYPRNGGTRPDGKPSRSVVPGYHKDGAPLVQAWQDGGIGGFMDKLTEIAIHKENPVLGIASDIANNRDWKGSQIADPKAPFFDRVGAKAKYAASEALPISIRNGQSGAVPNGLAGRAGDVLSKAESLAGVTPAPAGVDLSPAERMIKQAERASAASAPITPARQATYTAERTLLERLRAAGQLPPAKQDAARMAAESDAAAAGLSVRQRLTIGKEVGEPAIVTQFRRLSAPDAAAAYAAASPTEKTILWPAFDTKMKNNAKANGADNPLRDRLIRAGLLKPPAAAAATTAAQP